VALPCALPNRCVVPGTSTTRWTSFRHVAVLEIGAIRGDDGIDPRLLVPRKGHCWRPLTCYSGFAIA
jgi:hypothetical protein